MTPADEGVSTAWGEWIASLGRWDLFGGLTYDPRRRTEKLYRSGTKTAARRVLMHPRWGSTRTREGPRVSDEGLRLGSQRRPGRDAAVGNVGWFLREGQRRLGRPIEAAVVAMEYQGNGWPHFHPLLRLAGGLQDGDIRVLGPLWFQIAGYGRLERPARPADVCEYASKYLAKGLDQGDVVMWPRRSDLRSQQMALPGGRTREGGDPIQALRRSIGARRQGREAAKRTLDGG